MEVTRLIYNIIMDNCCDIQVNERALINGIKAYVKENGLEKEYADIQNKDVAEKIIRLYLKPITSMTSERMVTYFENYSLIKDFKELSNRVFRLAEKKKAGLKIDQNSVIEVRTKYNNIISSLLDDAVLAETLESEVSEVKMDIVYLESKSSSTSIRLQG